MVESLRRWTRSGRMQRVWLRCLHALVADCSGLPVDRSYRDRASLSLGLSFSQVEAFPLSQLLPERMVYLKDPAYEANYEYLLIDLDEFEVS